MKTREIIRIDEEKCDGCGMCVPSCAEGALQIVDGKAKLVKEIYCDGLGACLGDCPVGALTIEVRDADDFDETAVDEHLENIGKKPIFKPSESTVSGPILAGMPEHLMNISSDSDKLKSQALLIVADCVPFGYTEEQKNYIGERTLLLACPKNENAELFEQKLAEIIKQAEIMAIEVVVQENTTCFPLTETVRRAIEVSGLDIPYNFVGVSSTGDIKKFDESNLEKSFSC